MEWWLGERWEPYALRTTPTLNEGAAINVPGLSQDELDEIRKYLETQY